MDNPKRIHVQEQATASARALGESSAALVTEHHKKLLADGVADPYAWKAAVRMGTAYITAFLMGLYNKQGGE